jgi:PAS domain S-box-containing protein
MNTRHRIVLTAIGFGIFVWLLDALLDYLIFYPGSFWALAVTDVPALELYNRLFVCSTSLTFGFIAAKIIERRERALKESEARYQRLFNTIQAGVIVHDADTRIQTVNPKAAELLGLASGDLTGHKATDRDWGFLRADGTRMPVEEYPVNHVLVTHHPLRDLTVGIRRAGREDVVWVSVRADPVFAAGGDLTRVVVTFMDITARKQAEDTLNDSKTLLDAAGELAQVGGWEVVPGTGQVHWTDQTRRIHGVQPDYEPDLEDAIEFFHPEDRERLTNAIQRALHHGEPYDLEVRLITATGEQRWTRTLCRPQVVADRTVRLLGAFQDITEQKRTEKALVMERDRAQQYLDVARVIIVALDAKGKVTQINRKGCQVLGYGEDELIGQDWFSMAVPERNRNEVRNVFQLLMEREVRDVERTQNPIVTSDGEERIVAWQNALLTDEDGNVVGTLSSGSDITARVEAEQSLQRYTERLETLREMDQAILAAESPDEIAGAALARVRRLVPCMAAAIAVYDFERHEAHILAFHSNQKLPLERGTVFPLDGMEAAIDAGRQGEIFAEPDLLALSDPPPAMEAVRATGVRAYVGVPLLARGELIGILGLAAGKPRAFTDEQIMIVREVADQLAIAIRQARLQAKVKRHATELEARVAERTTDLRERMVEVEDLNQTLETTLEELRVANEQLKRNAHQLEATNAELEAFAYSVSHDLRAPLRAIHGFAQIIARRHRDDLNEEGRHYFDNIVEASAQMSELIDDLLRYSRLGRKAVRVQSVPVLGVLAEVRSDLRERIAATGAKLVVADDLPVIRTSSTLLRQICTNLIDNALTYHRPGVPPHVEIDCEVRPDSIVLSVADNGIGIPPEFHDKIFRIFQRLHSQEKYPGTGIGLSIVKKAAELLGGTVWLESNEGEGTTFYVELPVGSDQ